MCSEIALHNGQRRLAVRSAQAREPMIRPQQEKTNGLRHVALQMQHSNAFLRSSNNYGDQFYSVGLIFGLSFGTGSFWFLEGGSSSQLFFKCLGQSTESAGIPPNEIYTSLGPAMIFLVLFQKSGSEVSPLVTSG